MRRRLASFEGALPRAGAIRGLALGLLLGATIVVGTSLRLASQIAGPSRSPDAEAAEVRFAAEGPDSDRPPDPDRLVGAVKVTFDRQPIGMSFDLPWHFCQVAENGLKFAHFAAETYDPRDWDGTGADASFEAGMDEQARFARVWIEHQSPARVVVRVRYALVNAELQVAHDDLPTDSPYLDGKGDWGEERFTIYPDGVHVRHMKIHSGLAGSSRPFGFDREPPAVIHEFMETVVIGPAGHVPTDDLETDPALTLIRMFGNEPGSVEPEGREQGIAYEMPEGPPSDFGDFRDANILLVRSKSRYRPFVVALPYGVAATPYGWEEDRRFPFATWTGYGDPNIGYVAALGHLVNWWHYRRTETTIEQIYLHGMTDSADPRRAIMPIAWSWIVPPELQMPDDRLSPNGSAGRHDRPTYDPTQRAYLVPRANAGPEAIRFALDAIYDDEHLHGTMWLANPAIVVPEWNDDRTPIDLELDGERLIEGKDFRRGYEKDASGTSLVLWIDRVIDLNDSDEHRIEIEIAPHRD